MSNLKKIVVIVFFASPLAYMLYLRFQNIDMTDARFLATFWMQYAVFIAVWYVFIWFMERKK